MGANSEHAVNASTVVNYSSGLRRLLRAVGIGCGSRKATRPKRTAWLAVILGIVFLLPQTKPARAWVFTAGSGVVTVGAIGSCSLFANYSTSTGNAALYMAEGGGVYYVAGTAWTGGNYNGRNLVITASVVETNCGLTDVTIVTANGAEIGGTLAAETLMELF